MIEIVEGVGVGSGKSFYVLTRIGEHIAGGGTVVATDKFEIIWDRLVGPLTELETKHRQKVFGRYRMRVEGFREYIADEYGVHALPEQWITVDSEHTETLHEVTPAGTSECPVLLVLDESQDKLNARDAMDSNSRARKKSLFAWLCQSRHDDNDLIFITQNANNIDVQVRRICTSIIRVRNMVTFAIGGMKTPWWKKFSVSVFDQGGKNLLRREWLDHDPRLFLSYSSKSQKGAHKRAGIISKKQLSKVVSPTASKPMKFLLILMLAAIVAMGYGLYTMSKKGSPLVVASPAHVSSSVPALSPTSAPEAGRKTAWAILTEVYRGGDGHSFLHTDKGEYEVGVLCERGICDAISARGARFVTADGSHLWVTTRYASQQVLGPPVAVSAPLPVESYIPPDDDETKRLRAIRDVVGGYPGAKGMNPLTVSSSTPPPATPKPITFRLPQSKVAGR